MHVCIHKEKQCMFLCLYMFVWVLYVYTCLYAFIYVYICLYMFVYVYMFHKCLYTIFICAYMFVNVSIYIYIYIYIYVGMYVFIYVFMYIYIYVIYVYICLYLFIFVFICLHTEGIVSELSELNSSDVVSQPLQIMVPAGCCNHRVSSCGRRAGQAPSCARAVGPALQGVLWRCAQTRMVAEMARHGC